MTLSSVPDHLQRYIPPLTCAPGPVKVGRCPWQVWTAGAPAGHPSGWSTGADAGRRGRAQPCLPGERPW